MSSHHIIREKQEPALLIVNPGSFNEEYLGQLLEWSPTVLVSSLAYELIYSLGIKIDAIVGDIHTLPLQEHTQHIPATGDNFIKGCVDYLINHEYPSVNIVNDEEFNSKHYKPFIEKIDIVVFTHDQKIFPVSGSFSKWKPEGENIYIMGDDTDIVSFSGLIKIGDRHFRTEKDGFYQFSVNNNNSIFIAEEI